MTNLLPHGMLAMERRGALLFLPLEDVALVMEEHGGRVTVVSSSGDVAWRPGPAGAVAGGFFVEIRSGVFANPRHILHRRKGKGSLELPGGWSFRDIPAVEEPASPLTPGDPDPLLPLEPGRPGKVRASSVVYAERRRGRYSLRTTSGSVPPGGCSRAFIASHPHLVKLGKYFVNVRRLREIKKERQGFRLRFDTGDELPLGAYAEPSAARALNLPSLRSLQARDGIVHALYERGLRDWPQPLLDMPANLLSLAFGADRAGAIANVVWQVVRLRAMGAPPDYGRDHRGFWYLPLFPILGRLGMQAKPPVTAAAVPLSNAGTPGHALQLYSVVKSLAAGSRSDAVFYQYLEILGRLIGSDRLFTYKDLGFEDPCPDLRGIGTVRPDVVLVMEKSSLLQAGRETARRFGVSYVVLGGMSTLIGVEFLAEALRPALAPGRKIQVAAFVDFDPSGWIIADSFVGQMARYGIETESLRHLVLPKRFTAAEVRSVAYPLPAAGRGSRTLVLRWLKRSGGVKKRGLGIHADHLRPLERVLAAFREETGLKEVAG